MKIQSLKEFTKHNVKAYYASLDIERNIKNFKFDLNKYVASSYGIPRNMMPQIKWSHFKEIILPLNAADKISIGTTVAAALKPTQGEINMSKVMRNIAKGQLVDPMYVFVVDKNFHIIDGHHKHVHLLLTNPGTPVQYVQFKDMYAPEIVDMFNKFTDTVNVDIDDNIVESFMPLFESYGAQGPEAVPGMGVTALPKATSTIGQAMDPDNRGSGDLPAGYKDKDDDLDEGKFYTKEYLSELGKNFANMSPEEIRSWSEQKLKTTRPQRLAAQSVLDIPLDANHPLAGIMDMKL